MIVVDSAVLAGFALPKDAYHADAKKARQRDRDWHAPELCRSEVRSVAAGQLRKGESLNALIEAASLADASAQFYSMGGGELFSVIAQSPLSAYDSEFVALADRLGCKLVTTDAEILKAFPNTAVRLSDFTS